MESIFRIHKLNRSTGAALLIPALTFRFGAICIVALSLFSAANVPAPAASLRNQREAQEATFRAIENTRRQYEAESAASLAYIEHMASLQRSAEHAARLPDSESFFWGDSRRQTNEVRFSFDDQYAEAEWPPPPLPPSSTSAIRSAVERNARIAFPNRLIVLKGEVTDRVVDPPKPRPPVLSLIQSTEDRMIQFHEKNRIGSFDMDKFSERLLHIKRNFSVMIEHNHMLSARQEQIVRADLEHLNKDLLSRAN